MSSITHAHSNLAVLNRLSDNAGALEYDGSPLGGSYNPASVAITGGTVRGLTELGVRSTGTGAFDLLIANSENLTAARTLTLALGDANRALTILASGTVALLGTANEFTVGQTITGNVGASALTLSGATQTSNFPVINATQTWNNAATTFNAAAINVTATASATESAFLDMLSSGVSMYHFRLLTPTLSIGRRSGGTTAAQLMLYGQSGSAGSRTIMLFDTGTPTIAVGASGRIGFGNAADAGTIDAGLYRDAANVLAQRNSTNAQTFRIYNTWTSSTNLERLALEWVANVCRIGTQKGSGGGTARGLALITDDTVRLSIGAAGEMGFFGATAIAKPEVTGSRANPEQALADLLGELANLGLLTNSTTA